MTDLDSNHPPLPLVGAEYLPMVELGTSTDIQLRVPDWFLAQGYELWARSLGGGAFHRLEDTKTSLPVEWSKDLLPLELVCFYPQQRCWFVARDYLRRDPPTSSQIRIPVSEGGLAYVATDSNAVPAWRSVDLPESPTLWHPLPLSEKEFRPTPDQLHSLLLFAGSTESGERSKTVAVSLCPELTVGRLHLGTERRLNQSRQGSHWHLGWQRQVAIPDLVPRGPVPPEVMTRARDWMSRRAGTLRLGDTEALELEASSTGEPEEFRLERRGPRQWALELMWTSYRDCLEIHGEELEVQIQGRAVLLPWFWARRQNVEPDLEDRYYLWLPEGSSHLGRMDGAGGWLGQEIRWFIDQGRLIFLDTAHLSTDA